MKPGALAMRPLHRNLSYFESKLSSQKKNFWIEAPALNLLQRKDGLRRRTGESFEAALGIVKAQIQDQAQGEIENASEKLPMQGLALGLQLGAQPARSNNHIGAFGKGSEQLISLADGRRHPPRSGP